MTEVARVIRQSAVKNIYKFPAIKGGNKIITLESGLEQQYCLHLEFDPRVIAYRPQPKTFEVHGENGETKYTPDFQLQLFENRVCFVEVKPAHEAAKSEYQIKFDSFRSRHLAGNTESLIVSEAEIIREPLLENYGILLKYRRRPKIDRGNLLRSVKKVGSEPVQFSSLFSGSSKCASIREAYSWLAHGYLKFNISEVLLSNETEVAFYVS